MRQISCDRLPLPVLRGRAGVGAKSAIDNRQSEIQKTPTPTLPRSTGRGGRGGERKTRRSRGYMMFDVTAALVIVGVLALALAVTMGRQHRAAQKLADTRA